MKTLNKILLVAFLGCLLHQVSYAQLNPSRVNASDSRDLHGVINPLEATQTWAFVHPNQLQFWNSEMRTGGTSWGMLSRSPQRMRAREARRDATPDYTFTLITNGMSVVNVGEPVNFSGGGRVIEVTYTFPAVLQVSDNNGAILKSFEISSEENVRTATIHPTLLNDVALGVRSTVIPVASGFNANNIEAVTANMDAYLARIEFNTYFDFVARAATIIGYGYGFPRLTYRPAIMEVGRRQRTQFPELNAKVDELKSAIDEYFSTPLNDDLMNRLIQLGEYFESNYDPENASNDVLQLYASNAAMAFLLGGNSDCAYRHYRVVSPTFGLLATFPAVFQDYYPDITDMHNLYRTRNDREVVDVPAATVSERTEMERKALEEMRQQQVAANQQELAARNITDVPGYVMTADGNKVEGNISIKFVEVTPTQIVDTDLARLVWVRGGRAQSFRPNAVSYIMADGKRFEPVTIPASVGMRALSALAGGSAANTFFMEVIYRNGNSTAFISPLNEMYFVKGGKDGRVIAYSAVLRGGREADRFFVDNCPELQTRVSAGEFTSSKESLISFIDALAGCTE
ncbi:MAG: hypothetical protein LBI15_12050 [Dysgonamonadaceae bacterium]|jgi:hypothetical protein|nr:hypothetical protein [Dysgonamonadaceae bacterium]